jgi:hypothetical protein
VRGWNTYPIPQYLQYRPSATQYLGPGNKYSQGLHTPISTAVPNPHRLF